MKKEQFEWIHSWCDNTKNNELPRILLVGDSITYGYQELVREYLKGVCYVDFIATSYSIDNPLYVKMVKEFINNSDYKLVHFNFGLHGIHLNEKSFGKKIEKFLDSIRKAGKKLAIANVTIINKPGNKKPDPKWMKRVNERNAFYNEYCAKNKVKLNDLNELSKKIPLSERENDGTHYVMDAYKKFANQVSEFIKQNI